MSEVKRIFFSATLIKGDGSGTSFDGDPCEPGSGQTAEIGWWNPTWSTYEVYEDREDSMAHVYEDERHLDHELPSPAEWLARELSEQLNGVERHSYDDVRPDGSWSVYSCDPISDNYEDKSVRPAAHPEGFTADEIREARYILARTNQIF